MSHVDPAAVARAFAQAPALVAQVGPEATGRPAFGPAVTFGVSLGIYLLVGALLLAFAPGTARRAVERTRREPVYVLLVGIAGQVVAFVAFVLLAITVIGLVVAIPGLLVWMLASIVGTTCAVIALGEVLGDALGVEGRAGALVVGAVVLSGINLVPLLGNLVGFLVGSAGLGALVVLWRASPGEARRTPAEGGGRSRTDRTRPPL